MTISIHDYVLRTPGDGESVLVSLSHLAFAQERISAILGPSGIGKSLFVRSLLGFVPFDGEICFASGSGDSLKLGGASEVDPRRLAGRVCITFQNPFASFNPKWTIKRSLERAARLRPTPEPRAELEFYLPLLGLKSSVLTKRPGQLSGGELQRLSFIRAVIVNPEFLILDEPTSALDANHILRLLDALLEYRQTHRVTVLLTEHSRHVVKYLEADIYRIENRRILPTA